MDTAVALVRAYLHVNGCFTVTESPVLEAFVVLKCAASPISTSSLTDSPTPGTTW